MKFVIVGRPNVGKSTFFNRFSRRRSLVHEEAGTTRDVKKGQGQLEALSFTLIDTAGFMSKPQGELHKGMMEKMLQAVREADGVLFMIDNSVGLIPLDLEIARLLRKENKPIVVVANKSDKRGSLEEGFALGFGAPVAFSALHSRGYETLYERLLPFCRSSVSEYKKEKRVVLCLVGQPNVGKSTLLNSLVGSEELLTSTAAGTTQDSIEIPFRWRNKDFSLIDTAGLRSKVKITRSLEQSCAAIALSEMERSDVGVLILEAMAPVSKQSLKIANTLFSKGKTVIVGLNKWDLLGKEFRLHTEKEALRYLQSCLPQAGIRKIYPICAKEGKGLEALMRGACDAYDAWRTHIPTARLNKWIKELDCHLPPLIKGRRWKCRYLHQASVAPPGFVFFASLKTPPPASYRRFLENQLRKSFNLYNTPLKILIKKDPNPYDS